MKYTGRIENGIVVKVRDGSGEIIEGHLYEDIHKRWEEGQYIHTSLVQSRKLLEDGYWDVQTLNSRYKVKLL